MQWITLPCARPCVRRWTSRSLWHTKSSCCFSQITLAARIFTCLRLLSQQHSTNTVEIRCVDLFDTVLCSVMSKSDWADKVTCRGYNTTPNKFHSYHNGHANSWSFVRETRNLKTSKESESISCDCEQKQLKNRKESESKSDDWAELAWPLRLSGLNWRHHESAHENLAPKTGAKHFEKMELEHTNSVRSPPPLSARFRVKVLRNVLLFLHPCLSEWNADFKIHTWWRTHDICTDQKHSSCCGKQGEQSFGVLYHFASPQLWFSVQPVHKRDRHLQRNIQYHAFPCKYTKYLWTKQWSLLVWNSPHQRWIPACLPELTSPFGRRSLLKYTPPWCFPRPCVYKACNNSNNIHVNTNTEGCQVRHTANSRR